MRPSGQPRWVVAAATLAGVALAAILASCGGAEESAPLPAATPGTPASAAVNPATTPAMSALPSAAVTPVATVLPAGWEAYVDKELGFSLPHPRGLIVSVQFSDLPERDGHLAVRLRTLTFSDTSGVPAISLFIAPNPDQLAVEQWVVTYPGCCFGDPQPLKVGGEPALLFPEDALDNNPTILVDHNGFLFGLRGFVSSIPDSPERPVLTQADFQRVVEGFRFGQ